MATNSSRSSPIPVSHGAQPRTSSSPQASSAPERSQRCSMTTAMRQQRSSLTARPSLKLSASRCSWCCWWSFSVRYPRWLWWIQIFGLAGLGRLSPDLTLGSWFDRASARFVTFARGVALAGLAWLAGFALRSVGVPEPQPGLFFSLVGVFIVLAAVRWTYLFVRPQLNFSKWPVMGAIEAGLWKSISFGILLATALVDAYGEAFWDVAFIIWMFRGFIGPVTSQGVARRRAQHESIFGPH